MTSAPAAAPNIEEFLQAEARKDLLRLVTAGSVDDGKSTLIGRLLYDSQTVYEDQVQAIRNTHAAGGGDGPDLALLTDGLRAEREQGITIDVAYRYFATAKRKFILADTPGHEQYTRNMATGASNAELAILLVDATHGVRPQSRRHAFIASLLGIRNVVIAVNKMDLVNYAEAPCSAIERDFRSFLPQLGFTQVHFIPTSATLGENVVARSKLMPWYRGPALLEYLEDVKIAAHAGERPFRMAVQRVLRNGEAFRGYAGQIAAGKINLGDEIVALPSGRRSRVRSLPTFEGEIRSAHAPMSVVLALEDELDISRGDLLCSAAAPAHLSCDLEATLMWFDARPLDRMRRYLLKHTSHVTRAYVPEVRERLDVETFSAAAADSLAMNDIGRVRIECVQPLCFDAYESDRHTGSFILIDEATNMTAAAGVIHGPAREPAAHEESAAPVTAEERHGRYGHVGAILDLSAHPELAVRLERLLFNRGALVTIFRDSSSLAAESLRQHGYLVLAMQPIDRKAGSPVLQAPEKLSEPELLAWLRENKILLG